MVVRDQAEVVRDLALHLVPALSHLGEEPQDPGAELGEARMPPVVGDPLVQDSPWPFDRVQVRRRVVRQKVQPPPSAGEALDVLREMGVVVARVVQHHMHALQIRTRPGELREERNDPGPVNGWDLLRGEVAVLHVQGAEHMNPAALRIRHADALEHNLAHLPRTAWRLRLAVQSLQTAFAKRPPQLAHRLLAHQDQSRDLRHGASVVQMQQGEGAEHTLQVLTLALGEFESTIDITEHAILGKRAGLRRPR